MYNDTYSSTQSGDRVEEVHVQEQPGLVHRERVIQNLAAERRQSLWQITGMLWLIAGSLEALIGLRVMLKLLAANPQAPFARLVYGLSDLFVWPFLGLTITPSAEGIVLEIPSMIAMLVYALIFLAIDRLIWLLFVRRRSRVVTVYERQGRQP